MAMMDPGMAPMGPPPMDPAMGDPSMQAAMGGGMPSEDDIMMLLLQEVVGKWGQGEQIIAGEKQALIETLLMLAQSQPAPIEESFVEGGPMPMGPM